MYILRCDGSIKSYSSENSFGWWLKDMDISKIKCNVCDDYVLMKGNIETQQVKSVDNPIVYQETLDDCVDRNKLNVFVPSVERMTELIDTNSSTQTMLLAVINPTVWREKYRLQNNNNEYTPKNAKKKRILLARNQYLTISTETLEYTSEEDDDTNLYYEFMNLKMKPFHKESLANLLPKLAQIDLILNKIREEIIDMRLALAKIRKSVQEDEKDINRLMRETVNFTKDVIDTKHLDNLILLLNGSLDKCCIDKWPFHTGNVGSGNEKNVII